MTKLSDDEIEDIKAEMAAERAWRRRLRRFSCNDRTCGAEDCEKCNPNGFDKTTDEDNESEGV
jgi:hypothetical protein